MFDFYKYTDRLDFTDIELTPKEAIVAKCFDCCCYDSEEVKLCDIKSCPLMKFKNKWFKKPRRKNEYDKRKENTFGK